MTGVQIQRLGVGDAAIGLCTFAMMAAVFDEPFGDPSPAYVASLLARDDVWVLAAVENGAPLGGLTAFALPLTRLQGSELLVYDIAVLEPRRRQGLGRRLIHTLQDLAADAGIRTSWVPAADEDTHALDFYRAIGGAPTPTTIFTFERG